MSKKIVRLKPNLAYIRFCLKNIEIDIDEIEIDMGGIEVLYFVFLRNYWYANSTSLEIFL